MPSVFAISVRLAADFKKELKRAQIELRPDKFNVAIYRAGVDATRKMKADINKIVREKKNVKVASINSRTKVTLPNKNAEAKDLSFKIYVSSKPVTLGSTKARQTKKGVIVEVNKGSSKTIDSAFIRTIKGVRQVLSRVKQGDKIAGRLPVRVLVTTSVLDVLDDQGAKDRVLSVGRTAFAKGLEQKTKRKA